MTLYPDSQMAIPKLKRSFWMEEANTINPTEPPLGEDINVDIAIMGGGYVGLWTAIIAKQKKPDTHIAIFERDMCGGGASGRNGGMVMAWWSELDKLIPLFGLEDAIKLSKLSEDSIQWLEDFCNEHNIDAHFNRGGWLWSATVDSHIGCWEETLEAAATSGQSPYQHLTPEQVAQMSGSDMHLGGVFDPTNATVQPARLAEGLKRVALEMGVKIYEQTPVKELTYDQPAKLVTPNGTVTATKVIIATNVWATAIPELRKYIMPVNSTLIATEPMQETLDEMGLKHGLGITDSYEILSYYRTTKDGRLVYGDSAADMAFGDKITELFSDDPKGKAFGIEDFHYIYPMLKDKAITHSWSGPIDYTREGFPIFGHLDNAPHIIYGVGWSGFGVSPSQIGGRVLSSLALELDDEWSNSILVGTVNRGMNRPFPSTLIRYIGGKMVRAAVLKREEYEFVNREAPTWLKKFSSLAG